MLLLKMWNIYDYELVVDDEKVPIMLYKWSSSLDIVAA